MVALQNHDVVRIAGEGALVHLAAVPGVDEELNRLAQCLGGAREVAQCAARAGSGRGAVRRCRHPLPYNGPAHDAAPARLAVDPRHDIGDVFF